jgi:hypothetical protein
VRVYLVHGKRDYARACFPRLLEHAMPSHACWNARAAFPRPEKQFFGRENILVPLLEIEHLQEALDFTAAQKNR